MNTTTIQETATSILNNINKVIIGKETTIQYLLTALFANGHVLLEDVPGTGKTMLAKALAASVDASFKRIQFTPDLLPSDITGIKYYNQKLGEFTYRQGPVFTNILLADEINRATPRTQSSLLECMEERQVSADGDTMALPAPFLVIATQNPVETAGTFPLPQAQLDRFMMQLSMGTVTAGEERRILDRFLIDNPLVSLHSVCSITQLREIQEQIKQVYVHDAIATYMVSILQASRNQPQIAQGVSPRGSLALLRCIQAYAAIQGRDYCIPEDVKTLAPYVLSHRLIMRGNCAQNVSAFDVMSEIIQGIPVPTENFTQRFER